MMEWLTNNNAMVVCPLEVISVPEDGKTLMYEKQLSLFTEVIFNQKLFSDQINKQPGSLS